LQLERVRAAQARGTRVELWFADEARIGQKNTLTRVWGQTGGRPAAAKDLGFTSAYVFGAVCPGEGKAAAVIMPICNTIAMNHHLREISSQVGAAAHALLVLTPAPAEAGGAGWHDSQALAIPDNITLLALPPYSPELNPVERIWHYLRSHWLANSVFRSLADIMDACEMAWNRFAADPGLIRSLCAVAWAPG
jgi:hypothetical protein